MTSKDIRLDSIRIDGGTQIRAEIDMMTVVQYAEDLLAGVQFPRVIVFHDGADHWLADGFHRYHAHKQAERNEIAAEVRKGTVRDAILHAVGANQAHGLPRDNKDKRRAVEALLNDKEWRKWSDTEIAKRCGVSQPFVGTVRKDLSHNDYEMAEPRTATRNGTTYTIDTARIGRSSTTERVTESTTLFADEEREPPAHEQNAPETDLQDPAFITLDTWNGMSKADRKTSLATKGTKKFNDQTGSDAIEWALWSWNPVTGCKHDCPYCYARDIANRFYPQKFEVSLYPDRLTAPVNTPFPTAKAAEWIGHKNVFVCSMADLFGRWVPTEWIEAVLDQCRKAKQWNFLFLTKFPVRMAEFDFPTNAWVGTTVDCQARVANAERSFRKVKAGVKWLSCEPMIEPLKFSDLGAFDWVVIGGSSRSSETPEWHPPRKWVFDLEWEARKLGVKVYEKTNLWERVRQYPGIDPLPDPVKAPQQLIYLPEVESK